MRSSIPFLRPTLQPSRSGPTKQSLSDDQQRLLRLFQRIRFGRIHQLTIRAGEPVTTSAIAWTRRVKVLGDNVPHPCEQADEFALKRTVRAFFDLITNLGDGEILNIEIRNGLPFAFEITESSDQ